MRKQLSRILIVAALTGGVALAQGTSPQSTSPSAGQQSTTSPTQTQPGTPGQTSTTPSASLSQAQSQIQDALSKQMPSSSVSVSINSKNQLELTGTVASQSDKQRAEDIARTAAPGQTIVNKIKVSGSSSDLNKPK
jgi:osmotically-inducible protein OsmY